jgi:hypothetical protein
MDISILNIALAAAIAAIILLILPVGSNRPRPKTRAETRAEWAEARRHWQGHEGWGGRE